MFREKLESVLHRAEPGISKDDVHPFSGEPGGKQITDAANKDLRGFLQFPGLYEPINIECGIESLGKVFGKPLSQLFGIAIPAAMQTASAWIPAEITPLNFCSIQILPSLLFLFATFPM